MGKLDFFLHPKSIAVIGASPIEGKVGNAVVRNIVNSGFTGALYPINPRPCEIYGHPSVPSILEVPGDVDVAVVCIPAKAVIGAAEECGKKGVKGIIVVAAGFKEVGGEGVELEEKLKEVCKRYGVRCVGPNALGNITTVANMSFSAKTPSKGKIAMLSQSGAMMTAVLDWADTKKIGFSHFISLGNKCDVDEVDFIDEIADDTETSILILYLESVQDGEKFMKIVPAATRKKPVVILKSGTSAAGKEAASSHTGALAGDDMAFDLAFEKAGVIRATTMKELFDLANIFDKTGHCPPMGTEFVIVTNAGGPGIIATDAFEHAKIGFTKFSEETLAKLREVLPPQASMKNPVDIVGDATPGRYNDALSVIFQEPTEVCAGALVLVTPQSTTDPLAVANVLVKVHKEFPDRMMVTSFMGGDTMSEPRKIVEEAGIPCYEFPEAAINSLCKVVKRARLLREHEEYEREQVTRFNVDDARIEEIIAQAKAEGRKLLLPCESLEIINMYGIPNPGSQRVTSTDDLASDPVMGFPIVMKILSPDISHKTECGGVKIRINTREEAIAGFHEIMKSVAEKGPKDARILGIELQKMIERENRKVTEIIIGVNRDPQWGPMLMVGTGGIYANYMNDVAFELTPGYTKKEAEAQLKRTRVYTILKGVRGEVESDIDSVIETMTKIAQLVNDHPGISELDMNPVLVFSKHEKDQRLSAIDIKIIVS